MTGSAIAVAIEKARTDELAVVVAWLRQAAAKQALGMSGLEQWTRHNTYHVVANALERGDHLR